jgi:GT2 family glycosyltransferase
MELSIIIVSYNVMQYLRNCLFSVKKASEGIHCEIFVIDNHSSDGSQEMLRREFPEINLIFNDTNRGFSAANNQGIIAAKGKFVLLLNPDTTVNDDCFIKCQKFMYDHTEAGAIGVKMINGEGVFLPESKRALPSPSTSFFKITGLAAMFPSSSVLNRYYMPQVGIDETAPIEVIPGAFMFIRREALEKAGLFDEDYFLYGEDIELSYRLLKTGYLNYYYPAASIVHFKGKSTNRKSYSDISYFYRAMRTFARKRQKEKFSILYFFIIPATYLVESLAFAKRFFRIVFV